MVLIWNVTLAFSKPFFKWLFVKKILQKLFFGFFTLSFLTSNCYTIVGLFVTLGRWQPWSWLFLFILPASLPLWHHRKRILGIFLHSPLLSFPLPFPPVSPPPPTYDFEPTWRDSFPPFFRSWVEHIVVDRHKKWHLQKKPCVCCLISCLPSTTTYEMRIENALWKLGLDN